MTALSDALRAAQAQAIAALSKAYVAGETARFFDRLNDIGCTDRVEQAQLMEALDLLRDFGAQAPEPAKPDTSHELASADQMRYAADLADKAGTVLPDYQLTKANASKLIDQLKAGTYNPDEWTVPC